MFETTDVILIYNSINHVARKKWSEQNAPYSSAARLLKKQTTHFWKEKFHFLNYCITVEVHTALHCTPHVYEPL